MVTTRHMFPHEAEALAAHLLRLAPEDRRLRFQGYLSDAAVLRHVHTIDWMRTHVIGAWHQGTVIAAVEVRLDRALLPRDAELAVTVTPDRQGQGLGTQLAERGVDLARSLGVRRMVMTCLTENRRMRRIATRLAATARFEDGEVTANVALRPASLATVWLEAVREGWGWAAAAGDHWFPRDCNLP
ncbi:MAG: GNAT family N-acetyltransferase [Alphaproteobacteria bacterium]|nr:GNAT family N-acetyltransferase [Alphaproteobacteria bacterium]